MAFYLVTDGPRNEYGDADAYVVRASGVRQAAKLAPLMDKENATVEKLEDGRDTAHGVILSSLVDADVYETPDSTIGRAQGELFVDEFGN